MTYAVKHDFPMRDYIYEDVRALKSNLPENFPYLDWCLDIAKKYRRAGYGIGFPAIFWDSLRPGA